MKKNIGYIVIILVFCFVLPLGFRAFVSSSGFQNWALKMVENLANIDYAKYKDRKIPTLYYYEIEATPTYYGIKYNSSLGNFVIINYVELEYETIKEYMDNLVADGFVVLDKWNGKRASLMNEINHNDLVYITNQDELTIIEYLFK